MRWRTVIQRENAEEGSVLQVIIREPEPVEPELVYGDHFHCPACHAGYSLTEAVNPKDPWHICAFCGQVHDLRQFAKRVVPAA